MSVSTVIKAAMQLKGVSRSALASGIGTTDGSLGVKFSRSAWACDDVIRVAGVLGLQLAFVDQDGRQVVTFKPDDAAPPRRSGKTTEE